jgi:hypothetical protein
MRLNIFRNPAIDAQVGYLIDSYQDALRKQTEEYWRNKITEEFINACPDFRETGVPCIDCIEDIEIILGKEHGS